MPRKRLGRIGHLLMAMPPVALIGVFIGFPIVISLLYTLGHLGGPNSAVSAVAQHQVSANGHLLTLRAYTGVFGDHGFRAALVASVWVTALSVAIVLVLSWGIALYAWQTRSRSGKVLSSLAIVPMFIPVVIGSYAILQFWSYGGFVKTIADALGMPGFPDLGYTLPLVVVAEVWVSVPFGVLVLASGLAGTPASVFEAARRRGCNTDAGYVERPRAHEPVTHGHRGVFYRDFGAGKLYGPVPRRPDRSKFAWPRGDRDLRIV